MKAFENPEIKVIMFDSADVLTSSEDPFKKHYVNEQEENELEEMEFVPGGSYKQ